MNYCQLWPIENLAFFMHSSFKIGDGTIFISGEVWPSDQPGRHLTGNVPPPSTWLFDFFFLFLSHREFRPGCCQVLIKYNYNVADQFAACAHNKDNNKQYEDKLLKKVTALLN
jgi:hypothetical protein